MNMTSEEFESWCKTHGIPLGKYQEKYSYYHGALRPRGPFDFSHPLFYYVGPDHVIDVAFFIDEDGLWTFYNYLDGTIEKSTDTLALFINYLDTYLGEVELKIEKLENSHLALSKSKRIVKSNYGKDEPI